MTENADRQRVCIVGAGIMGLVLAERLADRGYQVTVLERNDEIGGLSTWHDYGRFTWDRFYHVILPTDSNLTGYLETIGLADRLCWEKTLTGFFVDGVFHSVSTSREFLFFPVLSLFDKFRLGVMILYCSRIKDWKRLEKITVGDWLIKVCGRRVYEKFWKPLLLAKLGRYHERVSAVFIWTYVKRMFSARGSAESTEKLGHVSGGYKTVIDVISNRIRSNGGEIRTDVTVAKLSPQTAGGVEVVIEDTSEIFDKVVYTGPMTVLDSIADPGLIVTDGIRQPIEYLGAICMVMISSANIVPYYVVNIADDRIDFTGIIGMSNLVDVEQTDNLYMTYFVKYVAADDKMLQASDGEIQKRFSDGIDIMFPDFDWYQVESLHVNRAPVVQPLQVIDFSKMVPKTTTVHPDFHVLNTAQLVGGTLNNNEVVGSVLDFVDTFTGQPTQKLKAHI